MPFEEKTMNKNLVLATLLSVSLSVFAGATVRQEAKINKRPAVNESTDDYLKKRDEQSIKVNSGEIAPYKTPHQGRDYSNITATPQQQRDYSTIRANPQQKQDYLNVTVPAQHSPDYSNIPQNEAQGYLSN